MSLHRGLRVATLSLGLALPGIAVAAEPVFPPGSSIGIVPPRGMAPSSRFKGFEGPGGSSVVLTEMPVAAMPEVTAGFTLDRLKPQGFTSLERRDVKVGDRDALLLVAEQKAGALRVRKWILVTASPRTMALVVATIPKGDATYDDSELRDAVLSTAIRQPPSLDEQVAALPFRLGDRAGFRLVPQIVANGLILTDGPKGIDPDGEQPSVVIAASLAPAPAAATPDSFGRRALATFTSLKDFTVEESRTFERGGATWHEILARAEDGQTGRSVTILQTIRFGPDAYLRAIATTPSRQRDALLPRFRQVAASLAPR